MPNQTSTKKRLSAAVYYLLTGLALGWPGLLATGELLPSWQVGDTHSMLSLVDIHLLLLGSMLTIALGVLYQIVPIAFQAPPVPRHVMYWHLPLHILSVTLMVCGFFGMNFIEVGIGGTLLLGSAAAFFLLVGRSYRRARNKTQVHRALAMPLFALGLVILVGIFQAFFPAKVSQTVILTHMLLGGFAFWGGLVLVFSYKLVPMFVISHGYKVSMKRCGILYFSAVVLWIVSNWLVSETFQRLMMDIGAVMLLVSLILYIRDMIAIIRSRKKRRMVMPMYEALLAMCFLVFGQVGITFSVLFRKAFWLYPSIYLFTFGGLIALMFAYMQKIVPFLWFEYRFSKRPERKTAPMIDEMVPKRTAQVSMTAYFVGVIAGFMGFLFVHEHLLLVIIAQGSALCMTLGSMLLFLSLRHVLTIGGPRPTE